MSEVRTPSTYEKPAIEMSSDVAGLLTFMSPPGGRGRGQGRGGRGRGGRGSHS